MSLKYLRNHLLRNWLGADLTFFWTMASLIKAGLAILYCRFDIIKNQLFVYIIATGNTLVR